MPDSPVTRSWMRRHRVPFVAITVPFLLWLVVRTMQRQEIGLEHFMNAMIAFQMVTMISLLVLGAWFLFFSGYSMKRRFSAVGLGLAVVAGFIALVQKVEFDGQMSPIVQYRWERTHDEALAEHLQQIQPATGGADLKVAQSDSPFYRGLKGDGSTTGIELSDIWAAPPKQLWKHPVGTGHAGIAIAGNSAITMEQREGDEVVVCYERDTGRERWKYAYSARFSTSEPMGGDGPRTTPAIADGDVYTLGANGDLVCVVGASGTLRWKVNILDDNGATNLKWAMSGSPLIVGDLVIVNPGINPENNTNQGVAAYDRKSGKKAWANGKYGAAYASPQKVTLSGVEQVLVFDFGGLGGYDPKTGAELWRYPWETAMGMNSAQPVVVGADRVFVSSEVGNGGAVVEVRKDGSTWTTKEVWKNRNLVARFANPVFTNGHLYGFSNNKLACVNATTGKRLWYEGNYGNGQIVLSGNVLVMTTEKGKVVMVAADPTEHRELGELEVFTTRTWNVPALAGNQLFLRNHREMAAYELPKR